jgi:O-antigen/teichoic acid export membrane protein
VSLGRGALGAVGAQFIVVAAGGLTAVLVARALGPEGKGAFTVVTSLAVILQQLTSFGVGAASVRLVATGRARPVDVIGQAMLVSLGLGAVVSLGLYLWNVERPLPILYGIPTVVVALGLASVPVMQAWLSLQQLSLALRRDIWYAVVMTGFPLFHLLALAALWGTGRITLLTAMLAYGGANLGALVFATVPLWQELRSGRPRLSRALLWDSVQFGAGRHVVDLSELASRRAGLFVVGAIVGPAAAGMYSVAVTLGEVGSLLPMSVAPLIFARTARDASGGAAEVAAQACRVLLALTILIALIILAVGPLAVHVLFGNRFDAASQILPWLLPGIICFVAPKILATALTGEGKIRAPALVSAGTLVALVAVSVPLVRWQGAIGAAIGTSVGMCIYAVAMIAVAIRRTRLPLRDYLLPRRGDFVAAKRLVVELSTLPWSRQPTP